MAEFKSRYSGLGFYVNGSLRKFRNGKYNTTVKAEIDVLEKLKDVERIDKPNPKAEKKTPKAKSKAKDSAKK